MRDASDILPDDWDERKADAKHGALRFAGLCKTGVKLTAALPVLLLSPLLSALPPSWKVFHKLHRWSAYEMQKAANADAVANVRRNSGHEDMLPARWVEGEEDEKDRSGWKVKGLGAKRYDSAVHGRNSSRMGKANMIHLNEDDTEQGTWAECAMDNALQMGRESYLFRDAQMSVTVDATAANGQAMADGGQQQAYRASVESPGILHDALVPISSQAGYDGQQISWNQYQTLKNEQTDQETVRDAKNQAWAAAKLDDIERADMLKWALILGASHGVALFHSEIGAFITGLTGGGGGGGGAVGSALGMVAAPMIGVM